MAAQSERLVQDIGAFIRDEMMNLHRFKQWWLDQHKVEPEHFPMHLEPGEWDEQFRFFCDSVE